MKESPRTRVTPDLRQCTAGRITFGTRSSAPCSLSVAPVRALQSALTPTAGPFRSGIQPPSLQAPVHLSPLYSLAVGRCPAGGSLPSLLRSALRVARLGAFAPPAFPWGCLVSASLSLSSVRSACFRAWSCGRFSGVRVRSLRGSASGFGLVFCFRSASSAAAFSAWVSGVVGAACPVGAAPGGRSWGVPVPVSGLVAAPLVAGRGRWVPLFRSSASSVGAVSSLLVAALGGAASPAPVAAPRSVVLGAWGRFPSVFRAAA